MFKKRISLLLVLMMVLSMMMPTFAFGATTDYSNHWAKDTIQTWLDNGYISGYGDGTFKPDGEVTRAEFVKMVNNAFGYTEKSSITFTDVSSDKWYYAEVQKAVKAGYISGYSDTKFAPNDKLTREQAALIIAKIKTLEGNAVKADTFTDSAKMASWSKASIGAVAVAGYMKGYDDGSFRPSNSIKRAEAIVTLDRAMNTKVASNDLVIDKAGTVIEDVEIENIHITSKVGSGDVTLKNVTVTGELLVEGGGENSIILENSSINELTANKADGRVRVLAKGSTVVSNTIVNLGATIESKDLTGKGFKNVTVSENIKSGQTLIIKSDISNLTLNSKITLNVKSGTISNLTVEKKAEGARIILAKDVKVTEATVNSKVAFEGTGTIAHATINANGITFEKLPSKFDVATGIETPKEVKPSTGSGSSNGGGTGETSSIEKVIVTSNKDLTVILSAQPATTLTASAFTIKKGSSTLRVESATPSEDATKYNVVMTNAMEDGTDYTIEVTVAAGTTTKALPFTVDANVKAEAANVKSIKAPEQDAVILTLPEVPGYTVTIESSSKQEVIDRKGKITPPEKDTTVTLVLKLSAKGVWANTGNIEVAVPAKSKTEIPVTGIIVTGKDGATKITTKDGTLQMEAEVIPDNATNMSVTWSVKNDANTTDTDLATISTEGLLTARKDGKVTVIATANDDSKFKGICEITISGQDEVKENFATLASLKLEGVPLTPEFISGTTTYTAFVTTSGSIKLNATATAGSSIASATVTTGAGITTGSAISGWTITPSSDFTSFKIIIVVKGDNNALLKENTYIITVFKKQP